MICEMKKMKKKNILDYLKLTKNTLAREKKSIYMQQKNRNQFHLICKCMYGCKKKHTHVNGINRYSYTKSSAKWQQHEENRLKKL